MSQVEKVKMWSLENQLFFTLEFCFVFVVLKKFSEAKKSNNLLFEIFGIQASFFCSSSIDSDYSVIKIVPNHGCYDGQTAE